MDALFVTNPMELVALKEKVHQSMRTTFETLRTIDDPIDFFRLARFDTAMASDPLTAAPMHLIEQVNQSFHYLVVFAGIGWLIDNGIEGPFEFRGATDSGPDIQVSSRSLEAECFAAVDPRNNRKINKDILKLNAGNAKERFVFYYSPSPARTPFNEFGVRVIALTAQDIFGK